jgi:hypothetical protein
LKKTASWEIYNMHAMTAAHVTLPFHTVVRVYAVSPEWIKEDSVDLRINDRGPYEPVIKDENNEYILTPHFFRVIDLSLWAHTKLFKNISTETTLREQDAYTVSIEWLHYLLKNNIWHYIILNFFLLYITIAKYIKICIVFLNY